MKTKDIIECEKSKIEKWSNFQLAHKWKTIGTLIAIGSFLLILFLKFVEPEPVLLKDGLRRLLLIGMLIVVLSKEKVEDEMIASLRSKSYMLSFVLGVLYAVIQPIVNNLVGYFLRDYEASSGFNYFELLFFMLGIHIMFFIVLKRNR